MGSLAMHSEDHFTYGDYRKWPEDERWELIDGVAYNMTPAPSTLHQSVLTELIRQIANYLVGKHCKVYAAPFDVRMPEGQERDEDIVTVVQPDITVVCDPKKLDDKGCRGAPDFIIEILSPATAARDLIHKKALYERHGVKEYWIVHPVDLIVTAYLLGDNGRYEPARISEAKGRIAVATLAGVEIDFDIVFGLAAAARGQSADNPTRSADPLS